MEGTRENVRTAMKRYDDDRSRTLDLGEFTQMVRDLPSRPPLERSRVLPCPRPVLSLSPLLTHASPSLLEQVRDLLEQQMAIEDAAADAAVAATPGLSPTSAAGSAVKYARAVGRDSPGAY